MSFTSVRRDLVLVVGAKAVSLFGDEVAAVALVLRLQGHGSGPAAVAALLAAAMLPVVMLAGVVGRLVDRVDSRRLLVVSGLLQASVCTVLASMTSTGVVLALVAVLGAGQAVNGATWQSLLPAIAGPDDLPRAVGSAQAGTTVAGIAAPAVGGVLVGQYGTHLPLLVDAGTFLAVTAAGLLLSARHQAVAAGDAGEDAPSPQGALRIIRADPLLRLVVPLLALFVLLASMVNVVEVFLIRETLRASSTWYGIVGAGLGVGLLSGALLGGRVRGTASLSRMFVGSAALLAVGLVAVGLSPTVSWVLPASYALGLGNGMLNVALGSLVMGRAAAGQRGRIAATMSAVASGTQLGGFVVAAAVAVALTPREIFVVAGAGALAVTMLLGRGLVRTANSEAVPQIDATDLPAAGEESRAAA